ncbi:hypothetical protein HAX54_006960 [Datura stramonium]|uniref:Pentatricopeptide repeat-containing protein n=1 Tax=Datura stramonium TaxID=4076 RepID=A0ABS8TAZ2_DATST|nr:hypothetical protein [Datura stramonium]
MQNSDEINLVTYKDWLSPNEVIKIFQNLKHPNSALSVLNQISKRKDYGPNEAIYSVVVKNLAMAKNFDAIEILMEKIKLERKCRLSDEFFYNVIKIYGHLAGRINRAIETLFDMPNYKCWPSVKTFNFVLNLLVNTKQFDVVHKVYLRASELGVEIDACCLNIIIKGLCRCGELDAAFKVFDEFPKQNCQPNVRTFSTIMHALCERGRVNEALVLFERMEKEDVEPDAIVFNTLISGLRKQRRVDEGIEMFKKVMLKGCDPNPGTYQEVLYALLDAKRFIEAKDFMAVMIDKRVNPSFESYKLIIHGLCDAKLLVDLDWVLSQMVRYGFVPRKGATTSFIEARVQSCRFRKGVAEDLAHKTGRRRQTMARTRLRTCAHALVPRSCATFAIVIKASGNDRRMALRRHACTQLMTHTRPDGMRASTGTGAASQQRTGMRIWPRQCEGRARVPWKWADSSLSLGNGQKLPAAINEVIAVPKRGQKERKYREKIRVRQLDKLSRVRQRSRPGHPRRV